MHHDEFVQNIVDKLTALNGLQAIVLGGSWASGTQRPDSNIDLGLYYAEDHPLDIAHVRRIASELHDVPNAIVTDLGEWGRWVNGGAWLTIQGQRVDFLYRNINFVASIIDDSDTPPDKSGGFLVRPGDLLRVEARQQSSGPLSPSVSHLRRSAGSRVPHGTVQGESKDIECGIMIPIQDQTTMRTHVRPHTERLIHPFATARTILSGEVRWNANDRNVMQRAVVVHPHQEPSPGRITDGLGKAMVLD